MEGVSNFFSWVIWPTSLRNKPLKSPYETPVFLVYLAGSVGRGARWWCSILLRLVQEFSSHTAWLWLAPCHRCPHGPGGWHWTGLPVPCQKRPKNGNFESLECFPKRLDASPGFHHYDCVLQACHWETETCSRKSCRSPLKPFRSHTCSWKCNFLIWKCVVLVTVRGFSCAAQGRTGPCFSWAAVWDGNWSTRGQCNSVDFRDLKSAFTHWKLCVCRSHCTALIFYRAACRLAPYITSVIWRRQPGNNCCDAE